MQSFWDYNSLCNDIIYILYILMIHMVVNSLHRDYMEMKGNVIVILPCDV